MNDNKHYLIDTDILIEHVLHKEKNTNSDLEIAMIEGICFTTVLNAAELYFSVQNNDEKETIDNLLKALKVLGLNSRYSLNISKFFNKVATVRDALICSVAEFNNLIIITNEINRYDKTDLKIIQPKKLRGGS